MRVNLNKEDMSQVSVDVGKNVFEEICGLRKDIAGMTAILTEMRDFMKEFTEVNGRIDKAIETAERSVDKTDEIHARLDNLSTNISNAVDALKDISNAN